jgi:hypothetical protein
MEHRHRLILDWILGLAVDPEVYRRDNEGDMREFGLNDDQRAVLLSKDPTLIRQWIDYELHRYSYYGHMHYVCMVMHGVPPPPPPPPPPG